MFLAPANVFPAPSGVKTIKGLQPDTTYTVSVQAMNSFGCSPKSPPTTVTTDKSDIEVVRVRSAEERDADLIKDAVDVDAPAKRAKK